MVDLSSRTMTEEEIPDRVYEQYLSGWGWAPISSTIACRRRRPAGSGQYSRFLLGIAHGNRQPVSGRWTLVEIAADRVLGRRELRRHLSPAIKHSGYDAIFFTGISSGPFICM